MDAQLQSFMVCGKPLLRKLAYYALLDKSNRKERFLDNSGVGMLLFSAALGLEPIHEIELDCKGSVKFGVDGYGNKHCSIEIGEAKYNLDIGTACRQLQRNGQILKAATEIIYGNDLDITLLGQIFVPKGRMVKTDLHRPQETTIPVEVNYL